LVVFDKVFRYLCFSPVTSPLCPRQRRRHCEVWRKLLLALPLFLCATLTTERRLVAHRIPSFTVGWSGSRLESLLLLAIPNPCGMVGQYESISRFSASTTLRPRMPSWRRLVPAVMTTWKRWICRRRQCGAHRNYCRSINRTGNTASSVRHNLGLAHMQGSPFWCLFR